MATNYSLHGEKVEMLVMYKECLHNHAAKVMGYAIDGCSQFFASGPNGTKETMVCAVCKCHRNFHKRVEVELPRSYLPQEHVDESLSTLTSTTTTNSNNRNYNHAPMFGQSERNPTERKR
ncbi:hypothetical protein ACJIZ3_002785 [Penstemon smallii]|uniref:ZF-HD dimerization-type domain-containing protein n=1 Tax=Penstemon smallii TaxID=265156 RepID=A0ABD3U8J2_9LAMI